MGAEKPIFLIGPTHVGKTYYARKLSAHFQCKLIDLDSIIEENAGVDISTIFDFEGEQGFRDREHKALYNLDKKLLSIVSTGAGIVLREDNQELLKQGRAIYLRAPIELLLSRVQKKTDRPLFQGKNPKVVLQEMHRIRSPLYEKCADFIVEINQKNEAERTLIKIISDISYSH